jgi:transposase InsO family protein
MGWALLPFAFALGVAVGALAPGERDPAQGVGLFCDGGARPPIEVMVWFIEAHRDAHGVEPICDVLPIAPSTYYDHLAKRADPARRSDRARRDEDLRPEIRRVFEDNWRVCGVRKVWRQLRREGFDVARRRVARLMKGMDIQGVIRGRPHKTTIPDKKQPCPLDKVNRQFRAPAPNRLRVSDFTYVATWKGFVYVAPRPGLSDQWRSHGSILDAYARRIVGWRVSASAHAGFVLDDPGTGGPPTPPRQGHGARPPQRPRVPIPVDPLHRATRRSWDRTFGRQRGRQLRQCARRDDQRPVQG